MTTAAVLSRSLERSKKRTVSPAILAPRGAHHVATLQPSLFAHSDKTPASGGALRAVRQQSLIPPELANPNAAEGNSPLRRRLAEAPLDTAAPQVQSLRNATPTTKPLSTTTGNSSYVGSTLLGMSVDSAAAKADRCLIPPLQRPNGDATGPWSYVTIVFDLDETLASNRVPGRAVLRPGATELLTFLASQSTPNFTVELVLWTASIESVARPVVQRLDPDGTLFAHKIYRDRRWYREFGYTKDLRRLGRDMRHTVIIENSPQSVYMNPLNAILVRDFNGGLADSDFKTLREVLAGWIDACTKKLEQVSALLQTQEPELVPAHACTDYLAEHPMIGRANELCTYSMRPAAARLNPVLPRARSLVSRRF